MAQRHQRSINEADDKQKGKMPVVARDTVLSDLPDELHQNIFSRLPIRTLFSCQCVCKHWKNNVIDEKFAQNQHLSHQNVSPLLRTFEPRFWPKDLHLIEPVITNDLVPPVKIQSKLSPPQLPHIYVGDDDDIEIPRFGMVNSCNGLLCVCTTPFNNPIYVCNPITGEYIMLPKPERDPNASLYLMGNEGKQELYKSNFVVSGFGFSPRTKKYKVMRMMELEAIEEIRHVTVQVLTLGSSSWKTIGTLQSWDSIGLRLAQRQIPRIVEASYKPSMCVYLNGAVHWLCNSGYSTLFIASFNFDNENIVEILPPPQLLLLGKEGIGNMRLGVLNDCLYLTDIHSYNYFKLWVLKDYDDRRMSWSLELVIDTYSIDIWPRGLFQPIKYLLDGNLLMFHPSNALVCFNPREKSFRYFKIQGIDSDFEMVPHIPSLVALKDVIHEEDLQVEILNIRNIEEQSSDDDDDGVDDDDDYDDDHVDDDWMDDEDVILVEEDKETIFATYSNVVLENTSFEEAFTDRHWS